MLNILTNSKIANDIKLDKGKAYTMKFELRRDG